MPLQAVVTLESDSPESSDNIQNTFSIGGTVTQADVDVTMELALNAAFADFYNDVPVALTASIATHLSPVLNTAASASRLDLYDVTAHLDGSPHGSPFSSTLFTLGAPGGGGAGLPSEVAVCVTMAGIGRDVAAVEAPDGADPGVAIDRPKQRRTGRIYIGPLNTFTLEVVSGVVRPGPDFIATANSALRQLDDSIRTATSGDGFLAVWSRADAAMYEVVESWIDNAFDTQRRRGEGSTARTTLAF